MGRYSYLISQMTWSYSRLRSYEDCPYRFLLTYIYPEEEEPCFYAEYGSFIHRLLAGYYSGHISRDALFMRYISGFFTEIKGRIQSSIKRKFFNQGLECMERIKPCDVEILGIENQIEFELDGYPFIGYVDMLLRKQDGGLILVDHKSHPLKQRSKRTRPTKSDKELDEYLRQLYLYSVWVEKHYGKLPEELVFHCYRTGEIVREKFSMPAYEEAKKWALGLIHSLEAADDFPPQIEFFQCQHICGVHGACVYYEMGG